MARHNSRSGGFFLMAAIMGGAAWGVAAGQLMKGILAGTAFGIAIVIALWLIDRRRAP